jgi:hypothetical protein
MLEKEMGAVITEIGKSADYPEFAKYNAKVLDQIQNVRTDFATNTR